MVAVGAEAVAEEAGAEVGVAMVVAVTATVVAVEGVTIDLVFRGPAPAVFPASCAHA